jgi:hypothetical protein
VNKERASFGLPSINAAREEIVGTNTKMPYKAQCAMSNSLYDQFYMISGACDYLPGIGTDSAAIAGAKLEQATRAIMQKAANLDMIAGDEVQIDVN